MGRKKGNKSGGSEGQQQPGDANPTPQPAQTESSTVPTSVQAGPSNQPRPGPVPQQQAESGGPTSQSNPPLPKGKGRGRGRPVTGEVGSQEQQKVVSQQIPQQQVKQDPPPKQEQPLKPPEQAPPDGEGAQKKKKKKKKGGKDTNAETDSNVQPSTAAPPPATAGPSISGKEAPKSTGEGDTEKMADNLKKLSLVPTVGKYKIPPKKMTRGHSQATCLKKVPIEVNYLPLTIANWNLKIYHYDVTFLPDKPKGLYRSALHLMLKKNCPKRHPAFDGKKNLYAAQSQLFPRSTIRDSVEIADPEDSGRIKTFDITIKLTDQELNMSQLKQYMERGRTENIPQDVIQAIDIALRSQLYVNFIPCARSFFSGPANVDLERGMELYNGFFQSAIVGKKKPFLNVDVANKAFPYDQTVLEFLQKTVGVSDLNHPQGLEDYAKRELQNYIKGIKVIYSINQAERRTYKVNGLGNSARSHKFEHNGREVSVEMYFKTERKVPLRYPNLPLLHVGPAQKNTMIPLEFCRIIGKQVIMRKLDERQTANMVKAAATATDVRKGRIMDNIRLAEYNKNEVLSRNEFGITVGDKFAEVESFVFKPPSIQYRESEVIPSNGEWRMDRQYFRKSNGIESWAVLIKDGRTPEDVVRNGLVRLLVSCGAQVGLRIAQPKAIICSTGPRDQNEDAILKNLESLNKQYGPLQIVVVVMPGGGPAATTSYSNIKRASELRCGILTQCLKSVTVTRKMNDMTAKNILLKMNAKVNGVNHALGGPLKPAVFKEPVMFIGADVTHPAPGSENNPSIAAVAASFDPAGFKYKMIYSLQGSRREMIENLQEIMVQQLKHFQEVNKRLPVRLLYYRDGVSEGQFRQVLDIELDALKRACQTFENYNPKTTFLVVQKRHHTRFFPRKMDGDGSRNNNVLAGTVVDTDITHPTELDFYLVSHKSIQGTARPTKYHLLYDENDFECEDLEMLTYYLCFLFSRCNRSVSYPAPTYYAHLGAFRARAYWDGQKIDLTELRREQTTRGTIKESICTGTPMFFV